LLEEKGKNTTEVWHSIRERDGSVQHLDFLSENEKNVFKTYSEIEVSELLVNISEVLENTFNIKLNQKG